MRTTLTLDDDILKLARKIAAEQERSLKEVLNEALRHGLVGQGAASKQPFVFKLEVVKGRVLPGVDLNDRDKLFDLMDGR